MKEKEVVSEKEEGKRYAGEFIAQVFVIHKTGIVIIRRQYQPGCISSDPQLIGAFLNSISNFVTDISQKNQCTWGENGKHELLDIGMSCSRWFTKADGNYTLAILIQNDSELLLNAHFEVIDTLGSKILDSFNIFNFFSEDLDGDPEYIVDFSDDFGKTIDIILFETINELFHEQIEFKQGEDIEIADDPLK